MKMIYNNIYYLFKWTKINLLSWRKTLNKIFFNSTDSLFLVFKAILCHLWKMIQLFCLSRVDEQRKLFFKQRNVFRPIKWNCQQLRPNIGIYCKYCDGQSPNSEQSKVEGLNLWQNWCSRETRKSIKVQTILLTY